MGPSCSRTWTHETTPKPSANQNFVSTRVCPPPTPPPFLLRSTTPCAVPALSVINSHYCYTVLCYTKLIYTHSHTECLSPWLHQQLCLKTVLDAYIPVVGRLFGSIKSGTQGVHIAEMPPLRCAYCHLLFTVPIFGYSRVHFKDQIRNHMSKKQMCTHSSVD